MEGYLYDEFNPSLHILETSARKQNKGYEGGEEGEENIAEKENQNERYRDMENYSDAEQCIVPNNNDNSECMKTKENVYDFKKYEKNEDVMTAVKITTQFLLNKQPFSVKRNDLFNIINYFLPRRFRNYDKRQAVIEYTKTYMRENLGLNLLDIVHNNCKEYILTQNILYEPHNNLLLSQLDHTVRGFLIFLYPFFKIFKNKIPLEYLLLTLEECGWKSIHPKEEIATYVSSQRSTTRDNLTYLLNKEENVDIMHLLSYVKLLGYINIYAPKSDKGYLFEDFYCMLSSRYEKEILVDSYIEQLLQIPDKEYYSNDLLYIFNKE